MSSNKPKKPSYFFGLAFMVFMISALFGMGFTAGMALIHGLLSLYGVSL